MSKEKEVLLPKEEMHQLLEVIEHLGFIAEPLKSIPDFTQQFNKFKTWYCKILEKYIIQDVYVLCKYIQSQQSAKAICHDPQVQAALERLCKIYPLYRKYCCRR